MKKKNKLFKLLTLLVSVTLLIGLFNTAGTAFADENDDTVYYDEYGNELTDPYNAVECYTENSTLVACPVYVADEDDDSRDGKTIPPGQMIRNGLSGPVVAVNVSSEYFLVETNFGIVQVCTNQTINASMIGQRVAVKLGKTVGGASEYAHNGTGNATGNIYRVATALQFRLIPSKGALKHKWGSVESLGQGCIFIDEEEIRYLYNAVTPVVM
jgi:hypothetical protein